MPADEPYPFAAQAYSIVWHMVFVCCEAAKVHCQVGYLLHEKFTVDLSCLTDDAPLAALLAPMASCAVDLMLPR